MVTAHRARLTLSAWILLASSIAGSASELKFEHVMSIGSEGDGPGQFQYIEDFAFTRDGHLLATDAAHAWVQVFDRSSGKFMSRFGGKGDQEIISTNLKGSRSIPTAISSSPTTGPASSRNTTSNTTG